MWELGEQRHLYIRQAPERAGNAMHLLFVDDLQGEVDRVRARGIEPSSREEYDNGVGKVTYRDPDGNEISFGGHR